MPRYLLQEDESALVDETGVSEEVSAANKTSSVSHKPPTISSPAAAAIKPHWTTSSPSPLTTPLPAHRTNSSGLLHKASADSLRTSTPHPLMTSVMTVEPFQTTKSDRLHGSRKSSGSRRGEVGDAPRVRSCDSHVIRGGPLAVCFPQITRSSETNQLTEGVRLVNLHATPISIAAAPRPQPGSHMNNLCERKKRRHGGGWPKGKSRRVDSHVSLPKPPATG